MAALLLVACGGDASVPVPVDPPPGAQAVTGDHGTAADGSPADVADPAPPPVPAPEPEAGVIARGAAGGEGLTVPEDVPLEMSQRHPNGVVLQVSGLHFEGNAITLMANVVNGATQRIELPVLGASGSRLRLIDDRGNTYNYVVPDGLGDWLALPVGESVGGAFTFIGPVERSATTLRLVWGVSSDFLDHDITTESDATILPGFVLDAIDLSW